MGCLMNVLWLVFGGILTAVEYDCQFADDDYNRRHSFRYANNEDGGACPVAFRQRGAQRRAFGRLSVHTDECVVDFSGRNMDLPFAFGLRRIAVYHRHRYSFRDAAFQTCRFGVGAFRKRYCGIITSYYPV